MSLNFNSLFGDAEVPFDCPSCGKKVKVKINNVNKSVKCSGCGSTIQINPDNSYKASKQSIDKSLKDLEKAFKNFGK